MALSFFRRTSALVLSASSVAVTLCGCATNAGGNGSNPASAFAASTFSGRVHGGQAPIVGATVTLWAAGAPAAGGAYGSGATSLGTALTLADGSFSFDNASGASPCSTGQYLYITAVGGNTGAGLNPYSALMAALPTPCNATTGATSVWINEVTTVAAVWSLQQFMSINPAAITTAKWQIGAPSSNVLGMANAFAQTAQLASIANGNSQNSTVSNVLTSSTYTTTITPDSARINTLADILASCVNTPGSSTCSSLFADTTPSSATAPGDTIQVAYYLATNPAGLTMPAHSAVNSPTYLCTQYVAATTAFLPDLTCGTNTNDWLIGVRWKTVNAAASTVGTVYANSVAIDASGNIWTGAGSGVTTNLINEFNQSGQIILNPVSTVNIPAYNVNFVNNESGTNGSTSEAFAGVTGYALGYARPFSLAIDTLGNAWYDSYGGATPGTLTNGTVSMYTGVIAEVTPTGTTNAYLVGSGNGNLTIDGSNNIYMDNQQPSNGAKYYISELPSGSPQTYYEGLGRSTSIFNYSFADTTGSIWAFNTPTTCTAILRVNGSLEQTQPATNTLSVTDSSCAYYGAPDASGNAWVTGSSGSTGGLNYINLSTGVATPTITTIPAGTGGLNGPAGVAIDGAGNVWTANNTGGTSVLGLSEFAPVTNTSTKVTTYTTLSPATNGATGFQEFQAGGVNGLILDSSGNIWLNDANGSLLYHMVGAAAPVVTPVATALANGKIAVRP